MAIGAALYPILQSQTSAKSGPSAGKLLIVGGDDPLRRELHSNLYSLGFDIGEAVSGEEALALCRIFHFDAVLMDADISGKDGMQTCAELRRLLPLGAILVLGINHDQERKLEALEAGADDWLTRPFHVRELTARIRAILRPASTAPAPTEDVVVIGEVSVDPGRRIVQKAGRRVYLTPKEFELLKYMASNAGKVVTHRALLQAVWGWRSAEQTEYLRVFVNQLRRKIEPDPQHPQYIVTEPWVGYRFTSHDA